MANLLRSQQQQHSSLLSSNELNLVEDRAIKPLYYLTPTSQHYLDTLVENDDDDDDDDDYVVKDVNQESSATTTTTASNEQQRQQQPRRQPLTIPSSLSSRGSPVSQNKTSRWDATGMSPAASTRNATLGLPSAPSRRRSVDDATSCKHRCLRRGAIKLQLPTNFVSSLLPRRMQPQQGSFGKDHLLFDESTDEESSCSASEPPAGSLFDEETLSAIRAISENILELDISEEFTP